jgi:uncharacterized membrane protein
MLKLSVKIADVIFKLIAYFWIGAAVFAVLLGATYVLVNLFNYVFMASCLILLGYIAVQIHKEYLK